MVWECQACGYVHDGKKVEETSEVSSPDSFPASWVCPICGAGSEFLEEISGRSN
ncbi:MAG: rubredoxin [Candidatus Sabulitectum sp.]|nr:rubredoxin [Candidatus Sabulitectum sp.]